jgi:hypothetical protein
MTDIQSRARTSTAWHLIWLAAAALVVALLLARWAVPETHKEQSGELGSPPAEDTGQAPEALETLPPELTGPKPPAATHPSESGQSTRSSARTPTTELASPLGSRSDEDAAWLRRYLYPTADELQAEALLTADNMPRTSREIAGAVAALSGEDLREDAERSLNNGAMQGSIYALIALAQFYEHHDPVLSLAFFRAAMMRGDWMVALRPPHPNLDWAEDSLASLLALQMLEDFDHQRALRGLPPLRREVRPGLPWFIQNFRIAEDAIRDAASDGG